jgi:hypothetical protein
MATSAAVLGASAAVLGASAAWAASGARARASAASTGATGGWTAVRAVVVAAGDEHSERQDPATRERDDAHQYFTQISSSASRLVRAETPRVSAISSAVAGFEL